MSYIGNLSSLDERARDYVSKNIGSDETVIYCMPRSDIFPGESGLVVLDKRVLLLRGSEFQFARSIDYLDIKNIEIKKDIGLFKQFRTLDINRGSLHYSFSPVAEKDLIEIANFVRKTSSESRRLMEAQSESAPSAELITTLERLAELHRTGALSDEQFEIAKQKILKK